MVNYLMTLGWTPPGAEEAGSEIVSWASIEADFALEDVNLSPAFFDVKKLTLPSTSSTSRTWTPLRISPQRLPSCPTIGIGNRFAAIAPHIQERLETLKDVPGAVDFLFWPQGEGAPPIRV